MPVLNPAALIDDRVAAIRAMHEAAGAPRAELDLSGGVDSAVLLGLLALALGPENVIAVHSRIHSDPDALDRARETADAFGVRLCVIDLSDLYDELVRRSLEAMAGAGFDASAARALAAADPTVLGSIRSTLRAPVGRGFNRLFGGGIRHGTGNECEDRWLRFYQKGGDGEVDSNPIAALSKGEVFQLALALGVPRRVITARPSPDLWGTGDGHNDEDEIADFLGVDPGGHTFYSYIDPDKGAYTHVGLIERVSRFADTPAGAALFTGGPIGDAALESPALAGLGADLARALLSAARRAERRTRHKFNPACPTLGSRDALIAAGILTDDLPTEERDS